MPTVYKSVFDSNAIGPEGIELFTRVAELPTNQKIINELETFHPGTLSHTFGVAQMAAAFAISGIIPMSKEEQEIVVTAAIVHDLGKEKIFDNPNMSSALLSKEESLTDSDWEAIRTHPGHSFLMGIELGIDQRAALIALHHHTFQPVPYPDINRAAKVLSEASVSASDIKADKDFISAGILMTVISDQAESRIPIISESTRSYRKRGYDVDWLGLLITADLVQGEQVRRLKLGGLATKLIDNMQQIASGSCATTAEVTSRSNFQLGAAHPHV